MVIRVIVNLYHITTAFSRRNIVKKHNIMYLEKTNSTEYTFIIVI